MVAGRAFGGDPEARQQDLAEFLYPVRDKVLDKAQLRPDDTVLDVGAGDGLIAFSALERLGPDGQVIFSDISQDLLDHCQEAGGATRIALPTAPVAALNGTTVLAVPTYAVLPSGV